MDIIGGNNEVAEKEIAQSRNKKFITTGIIIAVIIAAAVTVLLLINFNNKSTGDVDDQKTELKKTYKKVNVDLEDDDFVVTKDESGNTKVKVNAEKKKRAIVGRNNNVIRNVVRDSYSEEIPEEELPDKGIDQDKWIELFLAQIKESSDWIDSHYGLESWDFTYIAQDGEPGDARPEAYEEINRIEKYMRTGETPITPYWNDEPDTLATGLKYSAYYKLAFARTTAQMAKEDNFVYYTDWFKAGHPRITSIEALALEEGFWDIGKGTYNLKGTINTDVGTFVVLSSIGIDKDGTYTFFFFDVESA